MLISNRRQMKTNAWLEKGKIDSEETLEKQLDNANQKITEYRTQQLQLQQQLSNAYAKLEECNRKLTDGKELTTPGFEGKLDNTCK